MIVCLDPMVLQNCCPRNRYYSVVLIWLFWWGVLSRILEVAYVHNGHLFFFFFLSILRENLLSFH